jgi:SAM-dependent methyltransferase
MVEISEIAIRKTLLLAKRMSIESGIQINRMDWQIAKPGQHFDVIVAHDSLHHMDWEKSVENVYLALKDGGVYISMEPVCLLNVIKFLHKRFPFRSAPYLISQEAELTVKNIDFLKKRFRRTEIFFFDTFTRASVTYILYKFGFRGMIRFLSRADFHLIRILPFLKPLSSYVVIKAYK